MKAIGSRFDNRWNKTTGTFDQVLVSDTLAYIPLLLTLQSVLKQSSVRHVYICSIIKDIPSLQIQLFYDDFEPCNPLGSKKGTHKLSAIDFTLRNFPPRYNSCLANIHLCMLFHTQNIKKYGFATILEPLVNDLKILETDGIDIPGLGGRINGSIFQVTEREDYRRVFSEDHPNMRLRTKEVHSDHCQLIKASPEQSHVKLTLKYIAEKSISFKEISDRIQSFNYGYCGARRVQVRRRVCGKVVDGVYIAPCHLVAAARFSLSPLFKGNPTIYGGLTRPGSGAAAATHPNEGREDKSSRKWTQRGKE
ncbi:hypothetical protein N1851_007921 [Merluccius polli]|uniref:Uncharacterized protein n=1 Tax=Merluccius polli TaxID=89951 RepID=A0AA47N3I4_MERPO|nr:hypothetical protein N1851_007921 [Merluccius polli]